MSPDQSNSPDFDQLYRAARQGDKAAMERLMGLLTVSFRLIAQHRVWAEQEAEEVVQDALTTIVTRFREVEIETSFGGWAYGVLQNKILELTRKKATRRRLDEQIQREELTDTAAADPGLVRALIDCFHKIHRANSRHARILNLHYQGYTTAEICRRLGIGENNLYVQLSRARRALEICLGKDDKE